MSFKYPEIINENVVRLTAFFVFLAALSTTLFTPFEHAWSLYVLGYLVIGFFIRSVITPKIEPLSWFSSQVIAPAFSIPKKPGNAVPKRFAQFIGLTFSAVGLAFYLLELPLAYQVTFGILTFFAFLESVVGFCMGCFIFNYLIEWGILPESWCLECRNITKRVNDLATHKQ